MGFRNVVDKGTDDDEGVSQSRAVRLSMRRPRAVDWHFCKVQSPGHPEERAVSSPWHLCSPCWGRWLSSHPGPGPASPEQRSLTVQLCTGHFESFHILFFFLKITSDLQKSCKNRTEFPFSQIPQRVTFSTLALSLLFSEIFESVKRGAFYL